MKLPEHRLGTTRPLGLPTSTLRPDDDETTRLKRKAERVRFEGSTFSVPELSRVVAKLLTGDLDG